MSETITLAAGSNSVVTSALQLFSQFAIIGGEGDCLGHDGSFRLGFR